MSFLRAMSRPFFFGYGSLVNRSTHAFQAAHPARVSGWRRIWRHTDLRPVAYLTAVPDTSCEIDGLIAEVPAGDWAALDAREHAYDRLSVTDHVRHPVEHPVNVALYSVPDGKHGQATRAHPILLSYIDVVVQGYLREYGEDGAAQFFATTAGWDAPILNDRHAPRYPRHQRLSEDERIFVDEALRGLSAELIDPE